MSKKKPNKFSRGYSESRERVKKSVAFSRSCFNCDSYYQGVGDKEEVCQNSSVLEFDMTVDGNNIYCVYWKQCAKKDENSLFKNTLGRSRLD